MRSIGPDAFYKCAGLAIKGKTGSYADRYAADNNIRFISSGIIRDFDCSGELSISDAVILVRIVNEDVPAENGEPLMFNAKILDVNEDGLLTVADVTALLQLIEKE